MNEPSLTIFLPVSGRLVRNLAVDTVEALFADEEEAVSQMVETRRKGLVFSRVSRVDPVPAGYVVSHAGTRATAWRWIRKSWPSNKSE